MSVETKKESFHEGKNSRGLFSWIRPDGKENIVEYNAVTTNIDGKYFTIGLDHDLTERMKLQQELLQSQKMQSIGTLAGGIAHDFNNILGIILGYSLLLEKFQSNNQKHAESVSAINSAVQRGAALVRQILTFARKTDTVIEPIILTDLVHELITMLTQTFPKIITFNKRIEADLPYIHADRTQIHQAILNLCVNARDAMPNGGSITIDVAQQTKEQVRRLFPAADQDTYVCISVTDTGDGMDEPTRLRVFDPFFTTKEKGKGTGLGLSVVYGVVQSHHGFIDVESQPRQGTSFRLYFPAVSTPKQTVDPQLSAESLPSGGSETILIVEDEDLILEMERFLFESKGYKVFTAQDGNEAIKEYTRHKQNIDIVLTDMGLPGMIGSELFKKLMEINPYVSVILASGFFEPNMKSELYKAGAKGFIQKPYSPDEILRKVREVLDAKST